MLTTKYKLAVELNYLKNGDNLSSLTPGQHKNGFILMLKSLMVGLTSGHKISTSVTSVWFDTDTSPHDGVSAYPIDLLTKISNLPDNLITVS